MSFCQKDWHKNKQANKPSCIPVGKLLQIRIFMSLLLSHKFLLSCISSGRNVALLNLNFLFLIHFSLRKIDVMISLLVAP